MYEPIEGGSTYKVSFPINDVEEVEYEVYLPPAGYVHNKFSGLLERRDVLFKDKPKKDQKWKRTQLPLDWNKRRKIESLKKKEDPDYYDRELQEFINQEWDRRINGVWMMIDGDPVYMTGEHYFYCSWMKTDFGYPDFRFIDLERFYVWQYCIEDPNCFGMNEVAGRRTGKALDIDTPIPTPTGWATMGTLNVGDKVFDRHGNPCNVTFATEFQANRPCYKITFSDRSEIVADSDHLWVARDKEGRRKDRVKKEKVVTTKQMFDKLKVGGKKESNWSIQVCDPIKYEEKQVELPPYLLGLWLGDGHTNSTRFTNIDKEILDYLKDYADSIGLQFKRTSYDHITYDINSGKPNGKNSFRKALKKYGLLGNKHIPEIYMQGSVQQRKDLLAGLLDTDGCIDNNNSVEYCSKLEVLVDQVKTLCESLGYKTYKSSKYNKKVKKSYYYIRFTPGEDNPFGIARKYDSLGISKSGWNYKYRYITNIEKVESRLVRCITVDSEDHTFLCGENFIPTHNTAKFGAALLNLPTMRSNTFAGFQSKTTTDAGKVFRQSIVLPFKGLPPFFKPHYNYDSKLTRNIELVAPQTTGKKVLENIYDDVEEGLNSYIDYRDSGEVSYDGFKLHRAGADETGKTKGVDVYERWRVMKPCLMVGPKIIGKFLSTTTVEADSEEDMSFSFIQMTNDSDFRKKGTNGKTKSGLYTFFIPAYKSWKFDEYGRSLVEESKREIQLEAEQYEGDEAELIKFKRKFPFNLDEALMTSSKDCPFNLEILNKRNREIEHMKDKPYVVGDFVWEEPFKKAKFVPNERNGKWHVSWMPTPQNQNKVKTKGSGDNPHLPDNDHKIFAGVDPINYGGSSKQAGKSSLSCVIKRAFDMSDSPELSDLPVADYINRPENPDDAYEDILIASWFYGCKIHIENNKFDIGNWLKKNKCRRFIMDRPENTKKLAKKPSSVNEEGTPAGTGVIDLYVKLLKKDVRKNGHRYNHPRIINQMMNFTVARRTKFDMVVAFGFAEIAADAPYKPPTDSLDFTGIYDMF